MKKIVLLSFLLVFGSKAFSQITISAARALTVGSSVTIQGVVTNGSEFGIGLRYVQDATGGVACYGTALSNVKRGDNVTISGTTTLYNQLLEITVTTFTVNSSNNALPTPLPITLSGGFIEGNEGMLCELTGVSFSSAGASFAGNANYNVTDGTTSQQVRINTYSNLAGERIPCSSTNVIGIMGQFSTSSPNTGYQLLPRDVDDIQTISLQQSNISTTGFTVSFNTTVASTATLQYGLTSGSLTSTLTDNTISTHHCFNLIGLIPATVFYVKATAGSNSSCEIAMITASTSSGRINCYFNHQVDNSVAHGTNAVYLNGLGDDTLAKYIDSTHATLDIAIYNFDSPTLITAINNAANRGVAVRLVADNGVNTTGYNSLTIANKVKAPAPSTTYGIMHNKFFVMDAADANRARVWTGSMNMTTQQINNDENNVILFQDQSMAKAYTMEFEEMYSGNKYGPAKADNTPHEFNLNGKRVEVYFSPSDGTQSHIKEVITSAEHDFYFALLSFTRADIAYTIRDSVVGKGGFAAGMVDDTASSSTVYFNLYQDDTLIIDHHSSQYHHKYCIADANKTCSDPTVLTGSHNWSSSANQKNDENTVIVHDADVANQYYQEFYYSFSEQGGNVSQMPAYVNCGATPLVDPCAVVGIQEQTDAENSFTLYPNPAGNMVELKYANSNIAIIKVTDLSGRIVMVQRANNTNHAVLNTSHLTSSVYFVQLTTDGKTETKKLVIAK